MTATESMSKKTTTSSCKRAREKSKTKHLSLDENQYKGETSPAQISFSIFSFSHFLSSLEGYEMDSFFLGIAERVVFSPR
jgi:hypothetical protein